MMASALPLSTSVLSDAEISFVLPHALDFLYAHGFVHARAPLAGGLHAGAMHVPFALLPRHLPAAAIATAESLAVPFNILIDAIARAPAWLRDVLAATGDADAFTGRLLSIYLRLEAESRAAEVERGRPLLQPLSLIISRSDYMISGVALKQVELNTVAVSLAAHATAIGEAHAYIAARCASGSPALLSYFAAARVPCGPSISRAGLARALSMAHRAYRDNRHGNQLLETSLPLSVLFVVSDPEGNVFDQRAIEAGLWGEGVPVRRATLAQLSDDQFATLESSELGKGGGGGDDDVGEAVNRGCLAPRLFLAPEVPNGPRTEVSVIYFRAGYAPSDYASDQEWTAREKLERALAIKCPTLGVHLAGTKKVQQVLAMPGELERFVPQVVAATALRSCFAGLWPLDGTPSAAAAVAAARMRPDDFVIKPQREGGGHNFFGAEVAAALAALDDDAAVRAGASMSAVTLSGHILMERLRPDVTPALLVRGGAVSRADTVTEMGIYGLFIGDGKNAPLMNEAAGHLLRTKTLGVDEGGVAAGYAVLDSPLLI